MLFLNYLHESVRKWNEQQYRLSRFYFIYQSADEVSPTAMETDYEISSRFAGAFNLAWRCGSESSSKKYA